MTDKDQQLSEEYVRLGLAIDEHLPGYVDSYTGPEEWRQEANDSTPRNCLEYLMFDRNLAMVATAAVATARLWAADLDAGDLRWSQLPPLPDPLGVAGPFAGVSGGALRALAAGDEPGGVSR